MLQQSSKLTIRYKEPENAFYALDYNNDEHFIGYVDDPINAIVNKWKEIKMEFVLGLVIGAVIGVSAMCIVSIERYDDEK